MSGEKQFRRGVDFRSVLLRRRSVRVCVCVSVCLCVCAEISAGADETRVL